MENFLKLLVDKIAFRQLLYMKQTFQNFEGLSGGSVIVLGRKTWERRHTSQGPGDHANNPFPEGVTLKGLKRLIQTTFAWGIHQVMKIYEPLISDRKRRLFSPVRGHVLEIGPGTGPNLRYFDKSIQWTGLEYNPKMRRYLEKEAKRVGLDVNLIDGSALDIPLPDASVDVVVGTLVLCSVPCQKTVLDEVRRVLKPGGKYLFVEHVAAEPGTWKAVVQRLIKPVWRCCADGCCIDRRTWITLDEGPFDQVEIERFDLKFPVVSPHIMGTATR